MKKKKRGVAMIVLTVILLLLSAAAFGAKRYLSKKRESEKPVMTVPEAVMTENGGGDSSGLTAGANILRDPAVVMKKGTAYVRFTVTLADSDGTPFTEKLEQKLDEIENFREDLDPESPSYQSFLEAYHTMLNEYELLYAKGLLAFRSLCRDEDYSAEEQSTPNLPADGNFTTQTLEKLSDDGKISMLPTVSEDNGGDFILICGEDDLFTRQYLYKEAVSEGDICPLFTNIVIPSNWETAETAVSLYRKNDDGSFDEQMLGVNNMEIIGDGFRITVSAEMIDAANFSDPVEAFESAEGTSAVTEISSECDSSQP